MSLLGSIVSNYRTSVLYDFSLVVKANIFILKVVEKDVTDLFTKGPFGWSVKEALPLQLNPTSIKRNRGSQMKSADDSKKGLRSFDGPAVTTPDNYVLLFPDRAQKAEDLELDLTFDIYDEYNMRTMNGTIPLDISLADPDVVIIEHLFLYANTNNYWALFKWGPLVYFGKIRRVNFEYTTFSAYGEPLKGKGSLSIEKQSLGTDDDGTELEPGLRTLGAVPWAEITGYTKAQTALVVGMRIAEEAAALTVPTILRTIGN
ncbi:MAG: hypothetical protein NkDv07_0516 [Candidatus Improbicoccus devescovinae]|nr:MAG: hypothetical protein NkDv07_0516 [Candidatus Improbicoccus devescovinae]